MAGVGSKTSNRVFSVLGGAFTKRVKACWAFQIAKHPPGRHFTFQNACVNTFF